MTPLIVLGALVLVCGVVLVAQYINHSLCDCGLCQTSRQYRRTTGRFR